MSVDVGEEDLRPPLNYIDELVDALPAALALPVCPVQEQRLEELLPQPLVLQHQHRLLWQLFNSFQEPEVQVVLIAVEEPLVVGKDQVSGVVAPVDDVCQLYVGLVPTFSVVFHTHILLPGPESTAARIQTVVNL